MLRRLHAYIHFNCLASPLPHITLHNRPTSHAKPFQRSNNRTNEQTNASLVYFAQSHHTTSPHFTFSKRTPPHPHRTAPALCVMWRGGLRWTHNSSLRITSPPQDQTTAMAEVYAPNTARVEPLRWQHAELVSRWEEGHFFPHIGEVGSRKRLCLTLVRSIIPIYCPKCKEFYLQCARP